LSSRTWWKKIRGGKKSGPEAAKEAQREEPTGEEASAGASAEREPAAAETDGWGTPAGSEGAEDPEQSPLEEEVVLEEVILDEVALDDEEPVAPETAPSEEKGQEKEHGEAEASNGPAEGQDAGAEEEQSGNQTPHAFLQRKKTFVWAAGTLLFIMGAALFFFFQGNRTKEFSLEHFFSGADGNGQSSAKTVLKPFYVPLTGNTDHAALCLIVSVRWDPQTLARYREEQVRVRNEVYQFLLHAADSGEDMAKEKGALASKLSTVFQHALAAHHITVTVDEASTV
jgi:hypothetical protein